MTLPACDFYPDGIHHFVKGFWGWACDRCGRIAPVDFEGPPLSLEEEESIVPVANG